MPHWAVKYIGFPYQEGSRGPHTADCWQILRMIYKNEKGIILPLLPGLDAKNLQGIHEAILQESQNVWTERTVPVEGCIVAMGHSFQVHHVGIWIACDGGKVLHSRPVQNVVVDTVRGLKLKGLRILKVYEHHKWNAI